MIIVDYKSYNELKYSKFLLSLVCFDDDLRDSCGGSLDCSFYANSVLYGCDGDLPSYCSPKVGKVKDNCRRSCSNCAGRRSNIL